MSAPDSSVDATRRTRLASERTFLAWLRSGLAAFAVGLGAGELIPALTDAPRWPYAIVGAGFGLLGVALVAYGLHRRARVERALALGDYAPLDDRAAGGLAALTGALGLVTVVLVLLDL